MAVFLRTLACVALIGAMGTSLTATTAARAASPAPATGPQLSVDKARIQPGQIVTVYGRGFRPGAAVVISMGGGNAGSSGNYGTATADRSGRFAVDMMLLCYPNGSLLQPGAVVLVAHDALYAEKATIRLQVVAPMPSGSRATIQLPAAGSTTTFPLHLLARVGSPGEQVTAVVYWKNGTHLWYTFRILRGEDGHGLLIGTLDQRTIIPQIPHPAAHAATLELRDRAGSWLARQSITILDPLDPATQVVKVYWVNGEKLMPVAVRVPRTSQPATAGLNALLWGPPTGSPPSVTTALPLPQQVLSYPGRQADWGPRVILLRLTIVDGVATVDFSKEMRAYGGGSARVALIRQQITQTLLRFPSVHHVRIAIEGATVGVLEP
jgi:Sporulation and spore germination